MMFHFLVSMGGHQDGLHVIFFFGMLMHQTIFCFACSSTIDVSVAIIYVKLWFDSAVFLLI